MSVMNLEVLVGRLSVPSHRALEEALGVACANSQRSVELAHWLFQLLHANDEAFKDCLDTFVKDLEGVKTILQQKMMCYPQVHSSAPTLSQSIIDATCEAWLIASLECDLARVTPIFLLLAMLSEPMLRQEIVGLVPAFKAIEVQNLRLWCIDRGKDEAKMARGAMNTSDQKAAIATDQKTVDQYTIDLTKQAKENRLDPVIGRTAEIAQMIDVLLRRRQNNPIIIGEPGVGKTACVEGLAQRIASQTVPDALKNIRLLSLDLAAMQAGASIKGEFEKRLKSLIQEVQSSPVPIILFIDEAHMLMGANAQQGGQDAANMLKPALARGELRTIAATTWREYKKYFEKDAALVRRFQPITIAEPTPEVAIAMLRHSVERLENHHGIMIEDEALESAVYLSHRYLAQRKLPDKAMSLLDTACAKAVSPRQGICYEIIELDAQIANLRIHIHALENQDRTLKDPVSTSALKERLAHCEIEKKVIEDQQASEKKLIDAIEALIKNRAFEDDFDQKKNQWVHDLHAIQANRILMPFCVDSKMVAKVLSAWTGIPVGNMLAADQAKLMGLQAYCHQSVFGQEAGIRAICQTLITSGARLTKPNKPLGVFLLVGPSGVGKTETAHKIAEQLLGSADKMTLINMSEYKESHKASTLTGSPPGYVGYGEGGLLTEAVRREPHSLILLDEMEKAHPSIQDIFYQMLDRGHMRDSEGLDIDFRQTIIVMTSNAADEYVALHAKAIGEEEPSVMQGLYEALEKYYKPAFLGRVKVVPFVPLSEGIMTQIIHFQLEQLAARVSEHYQITLTYSDKITRQIQQACHLMQTGARQVAAIIDKNIAPLVAQTLLTNQFIHQKLLGNVLHLDVSDGVYCLEWPNKIKTND
jgi:type VI secretion system protein VasG